MQKRIWEIYERLSHATALMPPALAFSFDREGRTDTQMADLVRQSKGKVFFLPRRMLENYVLEPEAIAAVLNTLPAFRDAFISDDQVTQWLVETARQCFRRGLRPSLAIQIGYKRSTALNCCAYCSNPFPKRERNSAKLNTCPPC